MPPEGRPPDGYEPFPLDDSSLADEPRGDTSPEDGSGVWTVLTGQGRVRHRAGVVFRILPLEERVGPDGIVREGVPPGVFAPGETRDYANLGRCWLGDPERGGQCWAIAMTRAELERTLGRLEAAGLDVIERGAALGRLARRAGDAWVRAQEEAPHPSPVR